MNELDRLQSDLKETAETIGSNDESKIEPPRDPILEEYLSALENLANKYEKPDTPLECYKLEPEDETTFSTTYHGLNGELAQRAMKYREAEINSPLYPQDTKGKIYKIADTILNQHEFRMNERVRMVDEGEIPNPYKAAKDYIAAILLPQLRDKMITPELIRLVAMNIRKLDRIAIKNLEIKK